MARAVTELRVFVSSPGDVADERAAVEEEVARLNRTLGITAPVVVTTKLWPRDIRPGVGGRLQDVINERIQSYDIYLGILSGRLGTPTGVAASGTVEEFEIARKSWKAKGKPALMLYVRTSEVERNADALREMERVLEFQEELSSSGVLVHEYNTVREFGNLIYENLHGEVVNLLGLVDASRSSEDSPLAEADAPAEDEEAEESAGVGGLLELRLKLETKMAWLCKHLLAGPDQATYATIGSLEYDGFLTHEQARLATRILTARPGSQRPEVVEQFVAAAEQTVSTFRATVFDPFVRQELERDSWTIEDFAQAPGHRPDFLATKDGRTFRIAPRLITAQPSQIRRKSVERLKEPTTSRARWSGASSSSRTNPARRRTAPRRVRAW